MRGLLRALFMLVTAAGSAFISWGCISYFTEGDAHPFVLEKEPLPLEPIWLFALHVHIVAAAFALPACLALITRTLLRRAPHVHRWLGRVTGVVVLCALVPSGSWLALFAKGGVPSTVGFLLSGAIVAFAMVQGVRSARAGDFVTHRRYTAHVLAQLSVAVSSRALLVAFDHFEIDAGVSYLVALWVPVVASALVAELVANSRLQRRSNDEDVRMGPLSLDLAR